MTLEKLIHIKAVAALLMATVGWPFLSALLNILSRKKNPEQWEAWALSRPLPALVLELMRALGADPKKAMMAFRTYAQRKAGEAPTPSPAIHQLVSDPVKAKLLEEAVKVLAEPQAQVPQEPPASPEPASSPE